MGPRESQDLRSPSPIMAPASTHLSYTGYNRYSDGQWIPFGPIFHLELLNQVITSIIRCIARVHAIHEQKW